MPLHLERGHAWRSLFRQSLFSSVSDTNVKLLEQLQYNEGQNNLSEFDELVVWLKYKHFKTLNFGLTQAENG